MLGFGGRRGTFFGGIVELEEGVAGVEAAAAGAGLPGPPGPRGTSVFTGAAFDADPGRKEGSELKTESFVLVGLSANRLYELF